nr:unnamed protein product [Callosobruchus analis]
MNTLFFSDSGQHFYFYLTVTLISNVSSASAFTCFCCCLFQDYNFKEALAGEHRLLSTFGFYPDRSSNLLKWQHLRKVFSIAVTVNLTTSILFVVDFSNLTAFTETAVFLPTQLGFIGKLTMFYLRKHLLFHIENMLQKPSFYGFTSEQLTRIKKNLQGTYTVTSYFRGFTVVYIIIAITFPLLQRDDRALPYNSWQPYDITKASYYYATFASQIIALIVTAFTNSSIDVMYYLTLNIACCQLDLLMDRLKGIDYSGRANRIQNNLVKDVVHHYDIVE